MQSAGPGTFFRQYGRKKIPGAASMEWLWKKSARSFDEMSNLSVALRERLKEHFAIQAIAEDKVQRSADGTIKTRFRLHDGYMIESVLIPVPDEKRFTVCVSCQVGCSLTCKFCATGRMKRERNLDPAEIYDQVALVNEQSLQTFGHPLTNIVYMGMGEPLLAYSNVLESIERITSTEGLGMSARRITVSTAGIAKMIRKLADDESKVNLALSLHAADDAKRNEIMPINEQNNLESLMDAIDYFYRKTRNRISYEYIAFRDSTTGLTTRKIWSGSANDSPYASISSSTTPSTERLLRNRTKTASIASPPICAKRISWSPCAAAAVRISTPPAAN
jgi:23S rRNA (adenine2503-C2)-methyltransferase